MMDTQRMSGVTNWREMQYHERELKMYISQELKDIIMMDFSRILPHLLTTIETSEFTTEFALYPFYSAGVIDFARYNVAEKRFDQLEVRMAKEGITIAEWLPESTVYCKVSEMVIIPLV